MATRSRCAARSAGRTQDLGWWQDPPSKAASFTGMCIARIENGKIAEAWNNFDFLSMYRQLGMTLS